MAGDAERRAVPEIVSDIIDLGDTQLGELVLLPGSVLEHSLRRVFTELKADEQITAGFEASIAGGLAESDDVIDAVGTSRSASL